MGLESYIGKMMLDVGAGFRKAWGRRYIIDDIIKKSMNKKKSICGLY